MANVDYAVNAQDFEITIANANEETALALPEKVKAIEFQCRDATDIKHSFTQGAVDTATPPGPYQTLKAGSVYKKDHLYLNKHTLYVAAGTGSKVVEVRVWT